MIRFFKSLSLFLLIGYIINQNSLAQESMFKDAYVLLNQGDKYTNNLNVKLEIFCQGAQQMQVSNLKDFDNGYWIPFRNHSNYSLDHEGMNTIYVKLKGKGNISSILSGRIILDTRPPEDISLEIVSEKGIMNNSDLLVTLKIRGEDAEYMTLSNSHSFYGKRWRSFISQVTNWKLEEGIDGHRYVYAKFKDKAQNESEIISATILVDRSSPFDGKISIDQGREYTTNQDRKVELSISARESDFMIISENKDFPEEKWIPYNTIQYFQLTEEEGKKYVYVQFKDIAGNLSKVSYDDIELDITPPRNCAIEIDNGAKETDDINKIVSLSIKTDNAMWMRISNKPTFDGTRWEKATDKKSNWRLSGEKDSIRTVYIKFKDIAGNVSSVFTDKIFLKRRF